ncbi:MAG: hypothetical protein EXS31_17085 [Pedosphaera sp.]|nr:hypothetical protein [Pedosphaera sp.]
MNEGHKKDHWLRDMLAHGPRPSLLIVLILVAVVFARILLPSLSNAKLKADHSTCTLYCAQDQVFAEPIFQEFKRQTGLQVSAVFDSEAVKTVGIANRLIAEKSHPQCDVFWSNEELRTRQLAAQNVFRETNGWVAMGYRSRRIVINTTRLSVPNAPTSLMELTNSAWRGKVALAYPLFGTTATHFLALRQYWGVERWESWCRGLAANKPFLVDGNSVVVKLVARGDAWIGLTDSDDIANARCEGARVEALPLNGEMLLIPNTVAIIRSAQHPIAAERLFQYLQQSDVLHELVAAKALEGISPSAVNVPTLKPDWHLILRDLEMGTDQMKRIFLQ